MAHITDNEARALAERVRAACLDAAAAAYEDAGLQGLCADGRWESARRALAGVDLEAALRSVSPPQPRPYVRPDDGRPR